MSGTLGPGAFDEVKIVDSLDNLINPATEDKQDDIITKLTPFTTYVSTTVTLTLANTAYLLPSSEQIGRKCLVIYNSSDTDVYWGDSSVTTGTGILLEAGEKVAIKSESGVWAVCGSAGKTVNCLEAK